MLLIQHQRLLDELHALIPDLVDVAELVNALGHVGEGVWLGLVLALVDRTQILQSFGVVLSGDADFGGLLQNRHLLDFGANMLHELAGLGYQIDLHQSVGEFLNQVSNLLAIKSEILVLKGEENFLDAWNTLIAGLFFRFENCLDLLIHEDEQLFFKFWIDPTENSFAIVTVVLRLLIVRVMVRLTQIKRPLAWLG